VNFIMSGIYQVTFADGTLNVTDNNMGTATGSYKYYYTAFDGIVVTTTDGAPCDIEITINAAGDLTFKCAGLQTAQPLIKQ
jgi:VCBS repeat-containing protein